MRFPLRMKLFGGFGVVLALAALLGVVSISKLAAVDAKGGSMYADRVVPLRDLSEARAVLGHIDSQIQRAITDTHGSDAEYAKVSDADAAKIDRLVTAYEATTLVDAEKRGLRAYHRDWDAYKAATRPCSKPPCAVTSRQRSRPTSRRRRRCTRRSTASSQGWAISTIA
jgi:hypothetical protein